MDEGDPLIGVVGETTKELSDTLAAAGVRSVEGTRAEVLAEEPDMVVTVGEPALLEVARTIPAVPLLPVAAGDGFRSVSREGFTDALDRALDGPVETVSHPVVRIDYDGETVARAVTDVALVTAEVAHISEYSVATSGEEVAQFRADGVVLATPAGSAGYANRLGSPLVSPETRVSAITPIAPFATDPDHWVVPLDDVRLSVERDETSVTLLADDREVETVVKGKQIRIQLAGTVDVATLSDDSTRPS